jgi:hypothetical protein
LASLAVVAALGRLIVLGPPVGTGSHYRFAAGLALVFVGGLWVARLAAAVGAVALKGADGRSGQLLSDAEFRPRRWVPVPIVFGTLWVLLSADIPFKVAFAMAKPRLDELAAATSTGEFPPPPNADAPRIDALPFRIACPTAADWDPPTSPVCSQPEWSRSRFAGRTAEPGDGPIPGGFRSAGRVWLLVLNDNGAIVAVDKTEGLGWPLYRSSGFVFWPDGPARGLSDGGVNWSYRNPFRILHLRPLWGGWYVWSIETNR